MPPAQRLVGIELNPGPSATGTSASRWSSLYRDALGWIGQFMTLKEFLLASHTCSAWNACLLREGSTPQQISMRPKTADCIVLLMEMPLRRHIRTIDFNHLIRTHLSHGDLYLLTSHLPHLNSLTHTIDIGLAPTFPRRYPHSLTALSLILDTLTRDSSDFPSDELWRRVHCVIDEISHISTLTDIRLMVDCEDSGNYIMNQPPSLILLPLLRLKDELRVLHFDVRSFPEFTAEHIEVLRSFTQIEEIRLQCLDRTDLLLWYTAEPVPPRVKSVEFDTGDHMDLESAAFLARLPSLTRFNQTIDFVDLSFLGSLPLLSELSVNGSFAWIDVALLTSALSKLQHLHTLAFYSRNMKLDDLCRILSMIPHLHTLTLESMDELRSLEFTSCVRHLDQTLECLTLIDCSCLRSSTELLRVSQLRSLRRLELNQIFDSEYLPTEELIRTFSLRATQEWQLHGFGVTWINYAGTGARNIVQQPTDSSMNEVSAAAESKKRKMQSEAGEQKRTKREGSNEDALS